MFLDCDYKFRGSKLKIKSYEAKTVKIYKIQNFKYKCITPFLMISYVKI